MAQRMDIVCPRAGSDGRTFFTKIGSAWETKSGGWSLSFDALPIASMNDKGQLETRALLMVPRDKQDAPQRGSAAPPTRGRHDDDLDDVRFVFTAMHEPGSRRTI